MSSLDYRLRDSSHIQTQIVHLLDDLGKLLEDAAAILSRDKIPWDQLGGLDGLDTDAESESDDGSLDTELDQISVDVADAVTCLLRLSSTIRDPAPHDKFAEAQSIEPSDCELSDVSMCNLNLALWTRALQRGLERLYLTGDSTSNTEKFAMPN